MTTERMPAAVGSNDVLGLVPKRTEWAEIRSALRQEYGHPYTYNGVPCMSFERHVYVGRACALLLKAEKQEAALRELVALKNLKDRIEAADMSTYSVADAEAAQTMADEYARRKIAAWKLARDVLGPNVAGNRPAVAGPVDWLVGRLLNEGTKG